MRGSGDYDRKKKDTVVCLTGCAVVFFFVVAGNFDYDRKKKDTVVCWREIGIFFVVAGNFHYDRKKKSSSRLSGGLCCCVSFWFWRLRPEKKSSSRDFYAKSNVSNLNVMNLY